MWGMGCFSTDLVVLHKKLSCFVVYHFIQGAGIKSKCVIIVKTVDVHFF